MEVKKSVSLARFQCPVGELWEAESKSNSKRGRDIFLLLSCVEVPFWHDVDVDMHSQTLLNLVPAFTILTLPPRTTPRMTVQSQHVKSKNRDSCAKKTRRDLLGGKDCLILSALSESLSLRVYKKRFPRSLSLMSLPFVDFFRRAPICNKLESLVSNEPYILLSIFMYSYCEAQPSS